MIFKGGGSTPPPTTTAMQSIQSIQKCNAACMTSVLVLRRCQGHITTSFRRAMAASATSMTPIPPRLPSIVPNRIHLAKWQYMLPVLAMHAHESYQYATEERAIKALVPSSVLDTLQQASWEPCTPRQERQDLSSWGVNASSIGLA